MDNNNNNNENNKVLYLLNTMFRNIDIIHSSIENSLNNLNVENYINEKKPFNILDIGSSEGRNSNILLCSILSKIRQKLPSSDIPIQVIHADLEINNWSVLFSNNNNNKESYKNKFDNVFSYGTGNTFLNQLVPNESCNIIYSFNCFHWCKLDDGYFTNKNGLIKVQESLRSPGLAEFNRERLLKIFKLRCNELSNDGVLICNFLIYEPENPESYSIETAFTNMKSILREMANEGILSHQEVDEMVLPVTFYKKDEYEYAFDSVRKSGLQLVHSEKYYLNWGKFLSDNNQSKKIFITNIMEFTSPSIKSAIKGDPLKVESIYNQFYNRLIQQNTANPQLFDFSLGFNLTIFKKSNNSLSK